VGHLGRTAPAVARPVRCQGLRSRHRRCAVAVGELGPDGGLGTATEIRGGAPASLPGDEGFWFARAQGVGTQTLQWTPSDGDWTVVVMRADGSAGVDVDARAGVTVPALWSLWVGLLVVGGLLAVVGALLVGIAVHRAQSGPPGPVPAQYGPPPGPAAPPPSPRPAPEDTPHVDTTPGIER
jgi:hypothetical protein